MTDIDNTQARTIDPVASEIGRDRGVANAEVGSGAAWQGEALAAIKALAATHSFLISDDLWSSGLSRPPNGRALGAAFVTAKRLGYVAPTMQFVVTHQVTRHHAPVRVWRSKLRTGGHFEESRLLSRVRLRRGEFDKEEPAGAPAVDSLGANKRRPT
jgi:hypothetical protein